MADMLEFGEMNVSDRGGKHDYEYADEAAKPASTGPTPSQTVGPFFAYGLTPGPYAYPLTEIHNTSLTTENIEGTPITIEGQVFDGNGNPVHDAIIELLQADANGAYVTAPRNDLFTGFFRAGTGANGSCENGGDTRFIFQTIKPGKTGTHSAPFINVTVFMRGLLNHCITRMYFEGDDLSTDPVLKQVPQARHHTLIAKQISENHFRFDIQMQGENETVFFNL